MTQQSKLNHEITEELEVESATQPLLGKQTARSLPLRWLLVLGLVRLAEPIGYTQVRLVCPSIDCL